MGFFRKTAITALCVALTNLAGCGSANPDDWEVYGNNPSRRVTAISGNRYVEVEEFQHPDYGTKMSVGIVIPVK